MKNTKNKYIFIYLIILLSKLDCFSQNRNRIDDSLFNIGSYAEVLQKNLEELSANRLKSDCPTLAKAHFKIGRSYYYLNNKKEAIHWFKTSNEYALSCKLDSIIGKNYRNIGAIYCEMSLNDSSMYYLNKARPFLKKWNNQKELSTLYAVYFELSFKNLKDTKNGEAYLDTCEIYSNAKNDLNTYAFYLVKRGIFYRNTKNCDLAIKSLKAAKKAYESIHQIEGQMYALTCLASVYSQCDMADSSFMTMMYHNNLRDTIFRHKTAENLAKYQSLFEIKTKEIENLELKRKNQLLFWSIFLGAVVVGGISFFVYKIKSIKKQKTFDEQLREQQRLRFLEVLQAQEQERTRIASDLHDGVGHLLSAIRLNISALSKQDSKDSEITNNLSKIIDTASTEVRQISHQLMPQSLSELGLTESLNELANRINKTNTIALSLTTNLDDITISKKSQIAIYRIIQEILNNIIKHAQAKVINIDILCEKPKLRINISDDGKYFDTRQLELTDGIGWRNIKARIELFNGTCEIVSKKEKGTKTTITMFPELKNESQNE